MGRIIWKEVAVQLGELSIRAGSELVDRVGY
jgi:hypothetical protein